MDVTCKESFDFDCQKKKAAELGMEGYGMFTSCQKVTNEYPEPEQRQNCHFEPKKVCELQKRTRNKKAKRYSYSQDCKAVARNICETCKVKEVVPRCQQE